MLLGCSVFAYGIVLALWLWFWGSWLFAIFESCCLFLLTHIVSFVESSAQLYFRFFPHFLLFPPLIYYSFKFTTTMAHGGLSSLSHSRSFTLIHGFLSPIVRTCLSLSLLGCCGHLGKYETFFFTLLPSSDPVLGTYSSSAWSPCLLPVTISPLLVCTLHPTSLHSSLRPPFPLIYPHSIYSRKWLRSPYPPSSYSFTLQVFPSLSSVPFVFRKVVLLLIAIHMQGSWFFSSSSSLALQNGLSLRSRSSLSHV